jgi:hypothetical protein
VAAVGTAVACSAAAPFSAGAARRGLAISSAGAAAEPLDGGGSTAAACIAAIASAGPEALGITLDKSANPAKIRMWPA